MSGPFPFPLVGSAADLDRRFDDPAAPVLQLAREFDDQG